MMGGFCSQARVIYPEIRNVTSFPGAPHSERPFQSHEVKEEYRIQCKHHPSRKQKCE